MQKTPEVELMLPPEVAQIRVVHLALETPEPQPCEGGKQLPQEKEQLQEEAIVIEAIEKMKQEN
ncbi:MAG: hypothetical protein IKD76_05030 [Clostridia bacterium]|nr:hypothetical protein [Clostridia bacterium]